jgi:hypothetical protein
VAKTKTELREWISSGFTRVEDCGDAVVDPLALAMPSHSPFHTVKGFTLSFAKQVLSGRLDTVIKEIERNVGIV